MKDLRKIIKEEISLLNEKTDYSKEKDKGLHGWFERQGGKGKSSGWVDCNTCRKDSKTGRKKCKPCGREEGEKRSKYPACRPTPGACGTKGKGDKWGKKSKNEQISEGLQYHLDHNIPLTENIYRYGSKAFFNLINETRELYNNGEIELSELDEQVVSSDIGKTDIYEGEVIYLDFPLTEGENKRVNSPKKSGGKNYVYVKGCLKDKSKIKKITYGSSMPDKLKDPDRRKAFSARHGCEGLSLKDKCTRQYWSCRKPRDFANINAWW